MFTNLTNVELREKELVAIERHEQMKAFGGSESMAAINALCILTDIRSEIARRINATPRVGQLIRATKIVYVNDVPCYVVGNMAHECRYYRHRYYITGSYTYL